MCRRKPTSHFALTQGKISHKSLCITRYKRIEAAPVVRQTATVNIIITPNLCFIAAVNLSPVSYIQSAGIKCKRRPQKMLKPPKWGGFVSVWKGCLTQAESSAAANPIQGSSGLPSSGGSQHPHRPEGLSQAPACWEGQQGTQPQDITPAPAVFGY